MLYLPSNQKICPSGGMADAHDSKSCGKPCGFKSHLGHQNKKVVNLLINYFLFILIILLFIIFMSNVDISAIYNILISM